MAKAAEIFFLRRAILRWYSRNGRPFPWRETRDPYRILVSEVMLQQTQAGRVAALYPVFLERFPDVQSLARASKAEVLRAWRGMGYNNRAVRLHGAVKEVAAAYNGSVPRDPDDLVALPGIGAYTAHAVACFAHGRSLPVVDVNIRRVLSRIFHRMGAEAGVIPERDAWDLARRILPADAARWNQALMDFGAAICRARAPRCAGCPASAACRSAFRLNGADRRRAPARPAGKPEPSHRGIPRRVWRGTIVEALRRRRKSLDTGELLSAVRPSGKAPSAKWLGGVLLMLERDGVVEIRRAGGRTTVCLAR